MLLTSFLLLVLSICVCLCSCSESQTYYIKPTEGRRCPVSSCLSISAFVKKAGSFSNSSDMVVYFLEGTHLLDLPGLVVFRNLHNASFEGYLGRMEQGFHETVWQSTVVIKCTEPSGIAFANSSNITFKSITITNCGASVAQLMLSDKAYGNTALVFFRVANITVDRVSVQNGSGLGLLIRSMGSDVTISSSSFTNFLGLCQSDLSRSNLVLVYINPIVCPSESRSYETHITNTNVSLGMGCGELDGGLVVILSQSSYETYVVLDSIVAYNTSNKSNIKFIISRYVPQYTVVINNTMSSHAQTSRGLTMETDYRESSFSGSCQNLTRSSLAVSKCLILNSKFTRNGHSTSTSYGGGIYISHTSDEHSLMVTIESTVISHNQGSVGIGLVLGQPDFESQFIATLNNVTFNDNYMNLIPQVDFSVVLALFVTILKLVNVRITNNNSAGFIASNTTVLVSNNSQFILHNNSGVDGGGLALYAGSKLLFEECARLTFTNNSATDRGGAIFVEDSTHLFSTLRPSCFFQYNDSISLPSVYFSGNTAHVAGSAVFGGNIDNCYLISQRKINGELFDKIFNYTDQNGFSVISSSPSQVCFCHSDTPNCSFSTWNMSAYPGEDVTFSVVTVGQRNGVVPGKIFLQSDYKSPVIDSRLHNTDAFKCMNISTKLHYSGYSKFIVNSVMIATSGYMPESLKYLNITVLDCPVGSNLTDDTQTCQLPYCKGLQELVPNIKCSVGISRQGNYWIGFDNTTQCTVVVGECSYQYCEKSEVNFTLADPDPQCAPNRTGRMCGECKNGLGFSLESNSCTPCSNSHIALILPLLATCFGLVALLMVLNLTVSAGTINGLIFYANIVKVNEHIFFQHGPIPVLSLFISWLNLDLGIETCFFNGMTAYVKVWLQFMFPLFIWAIIATIIVLCRYSTWLSNRIGSNVVQVLATLILLSYTKLFRVIVLALKWTSLTCIPSGQTKLVWFEDGNLDYFSWKHMLLLVVALAFLILAVLYTLVLLFDTLIEKYLTKLRFFRKWKARFKPLIDAYNGPYKDRCRFWTGLLLLARLVFVLVACTSNPDATGSIYMQVAINTITIIILSLMVFFRGVYQKKYLDILECWSLLNLALLSASSAIKWDKVRVSISVSLMMVTFIGVIIYHIFLRLRDMKCFKKFFNKMAKRENYSNETEPLLDNDEDNERERAMIAPTSCEVYLKREPLLY